MLNVQTLAVGDELFIPGTGFLTVLALEAGEVLFVVSVRNASERTPSDQPGDPAELPS